MCLETFNGCPNCKAGVDDISYEVTEYVDVSYNICEDGYPEDTRHVGDRDDCGNEGRFYCHNCGHCDFTELEQDIEPPDCDCEECEPDQYVEDPDQVVLLVRGTHHPTWRPDRDDCPIELRALYTRRSIGCIPCRRERADAVIQWLADNGYNGNRLAHIDSVAPIPGHLHDLQPREQEAA